MHCSVPQNVISKASSIGKKSDQPRKSGLHGAVKGPSTQLVRRPRLESSRPQVQKKDVSIFLSKHPINTTRSFQRFHQRALANPRSFEREKGHKDWKVREE